MRLVNPRHRYEDIFLSKRPPDTELERSLYVVLHGVPELNKAVPFRTWEEGEQIDPSLPYPLEIHGLDELRHILEPFLLATENDAEVAEALAMGQDEVSTYRHLFFDTDVFRTDLELIAYMRAIPESSEYKPLYKIAFHQGIGALRWHFCRNKGSVEPEEVVRNIMLDSYYRYLEHRGRPVTSKVAKEALKFSKVSLDCARTLTEQGDVGSEDTESLRVKFEKAKENRSIDDFQRSSVGEILH